MAYLNVDEIEAALQSLAAAYPSATELIPCPNPTHDGRTSHVLRVGTSQAAGAEGVLLLGGVHAREWVPPDALVSLAADLLEAHQLGTGLVYGGQRYTADDVRDVIGKVNLFVYACVNPDGRHHSQTVEAMWRKNRRPNPLGGGCVGVDLNRNFDFLWDHVHKFAPDAGVRSSDNPCDPQVYRGPSPASEPETRNVVWLLDSYPRIRWHVDVHSHVPDILHPWGDDQNQTMHPQQNFLAAGFDAVRGRADDGAYGEYITPADLDLHRNRAVGMQAAISAVQGDTYVVDQAYGLYPTSGTSDDYAFSRHLADGAKPTVYGFTIECGHSFQPAWADAENVIREVDAGLLALAVAVAADAGTPVTSAVA